MSRMKCRHQVLLYEMKYDYCLLANIFYKALATFANQALKGVSSTHQIDMLGKYQRIKKEDIIAAFRKYFMPVFDPASSVAVVVTDTGEVESIVGGLTSLGFDVTQKELHTDLPNTEKGKSRGEVGL